MEIFTDEGLIPATQVRKESGNPKFVFMKVTSTGRKMLKSGVKGPLEACEQSEKIGSSTTVSSCTPNEGSNVRNSCQGSRQVYPLHDQGSDASKTTSVFRSCAIPEGALK